MTPVGRNVGRAKRKLVKKKQALQDLFERNQGLAYKISNIFWANNSAKFRSLVMDKKDVEQIALHELSLLVPKYDSRVKFSTFAWTGIENRLKGELKRAVAKKRKHGPIKSLSEKLGDSERTLESIIEHRGQEVNSAELKKFRDKAVEIVNDLKHFKPKHKAFFFEHFGLFGIPGKSFSEIAREHKASASEVRIYVMKIVEKLRRHPEMRQYEDLL